MQVFVFKDGQQLGPFDEGEVSARLWDGKFSGEDLGIREGDTQWKPLNVLFPQTAQPPGFQPPLPPAVAVAAASPAAVEQPALYRKTLFAKVFFGLTLLGAIVLTVGAAAYWKFVLVPSGNLTTDLGNAPFRSFAIYTAIAGVGMTVLTFFALLLCFKRRIIGSNGLRIFLRLFFVLVLLIGLADIGYGAFSYFNWRPTTSTVSSQNSAGNDLLKALDEGEKVAGPLTQLGIFLPIGLGFIFLGLSGIAMTKSSGTAAQL